jgi:hypothetical protein
VTRRGSARVAGFAFLFYIAVGIASLVLFGRATSAQGTAGTLARIAEHAADVRLSAVLTLLGSFSALVLAVTLYGITRDEDHEVAMLAMACRLTEGVIGGVSIDQTLGLLWLATASGPTAPDSAGAQAIAAFLLGQRSATVSATFFAVGSTLFSWLLLRGRMIPVPMAWLGVAASVLLVVVLPLQLGGLRSDGIVGWLVWLPMLVFELVFAFWLLVKGVAPARR